MNKHHIKESLVITFLLMLAMLLLQYVPLNFEIAKPVKQEFNDFDVYDIIYSGEAAGNHTRDSNIVIIQAAKTRREIVGQLDLLQKFQPAIIGVDLTFIGHSNDLQADSLLQQQLQKSNIITGNRIDLDDTHHPVIIPNFFDSSFEHSGYFNFWGGAISVVRYYPPFREINNTLAYSFTSRIAEKFNRSRFLILKDRYQKAQIINYKGNIESYTSFLNDHFDTVQLGEKVRGKIVLLGDLYKNEHLVLDDLHYTPMNEKINGKSFPDMYGVVIHANILSMILSGKYITQLGKGWSYLISLVLTFLLVYYQMGKYYEKKHTLDLWFFFLQFIIIIILVCISLFIYKSVHYKISLLPIVIPLILCIEVVELYKFIVKRFFKKSRYKSIFKTHK